MEITQEQKLNIQVVERAWNDAQFKSELIANPVEAMEKLTGHKINLPEGHKLVVVDQMDESTVYFNIPRKIDVDSLELNEKQLEMIAGGITPTYIAFGLGFALAGVFWGATHN